MAEDTDAVYHEADFITTTDAAAMLGWAVYRTSQYLRRRGLQPYMKVGERQHYWLKGEVQSLRQSMRTLQKVTRE